MPPRGARDSQLSETLGTTGKTALQGRQKETGRQGQSCTSVCQGPHYQGHLNGMETRWRGKGPQAVQLEADDQGQPDPSRGCKSKYLTVSWWWQLPHQPWGLREGAGDRVGGRLRQTQRVPLRPPECPWDLRTNVDPAVGRGGPGSRPTKT